MRGQARLVRFAALFLSACLLVTAAAPASAALPAEAGVCKASTGPSIPPPAQVPSGVPGYHAYWYGQSGYPTLCPGERSTAVVAYYNSGTRGWLLGAPGQTAYLGTWGPDPGQDRPSPLGGEATGWPVYDRVARQPAEFVGPNQVAWFQFTIEAPKTPGYYQLYLRPLIEGTTWLEDFGVYWQVTVLAPDGALPPEPVCDGDCWPLTGVPTGGGPALRRPFVARIDNVIPARPHYGLSQADIVFEMLVEGQVTRLAAIFHSQDPQVIGGVRSARLSDRQTTPMVRGALVYSGATIEETEAIRNDARAGAYYDLNAGYVDAGYYRVGFRRSPYNEFTSSDGVRAALNRLPGGGDPVQVPAWDFLRRADHDPLAGGFSASAPASTLTIPYRAGATVRYDYDAATRTYARYQDSGGWQREVDAANNRPVAARNVIVLHTDIWQTQIVEDIFQSKGLDMNLVGEGRAEIFRDGRRVDGVWARATIFDQLRFYTRQGERIYLSPGQTWVHPVYQDWTIPSH